MNTRKIITPEDHHTLNNFGVIYNESFSMKSDVIVVGSGAGGSVAASELARAGFSVVLLEEGPYIESHDYSPDEYKTLSRIYQDAAYVSSENFSMHILAGRVTGGSTTINWQTCIYPEDTTTLQWKNEFGLSGYSRAEMKPYIDEIEKRIGAARVPKNMINENNRLLMKGAKKLSLNYEINRNNNGGNCIGLGRCGLGCPIDAKKSAVISFIPDAVKHGALVFSNVSADLISDSPDGEVKTVKASYSPDPGKPAAARSIKNFRFTAAIVIVSGGALGSPVLLQRSNLGNKFVGQRLKVHPTASVLGHFPNPVEAFYGTPQSVIIEQFKNLDNTGYGFLLEVAPYRPTIATLLTPFFGKDTFDFMRNYNNLQTGIVIVRDGADGNINGSVEYSGDEEMPRKVEFKLSKADGINLLKGIRQMALIQQAAGATEIVFPFSSLEKPFTVNKNSNFDWVLNQKTTPGDLLLGSAHPHGTIQASGSPDMGALNPDFELYGHKNIYVIDGCWPPTSIGVNPQILIMSSALKGTRKIIKKLQKS